MDMVLTRNHSLSHGIYGTLFDDTGGVVAYTLEHAYLNDKDHFAPKVPIGTYTCVRGEHRLEGMTVDFETFEITGVQGHSGILFHVGNYNKDSNGCVLLGTGVDLNNYMVTASRLAFSSFMQLEAGVDEFTLTVK